MTSLPAGWTTAALPELVELNPRSFESSLSDDDLLSFVPMASVQEQTGRLDATASRRWGAVKKGYTRFQEGDLLFAKITPCMENGKFALAKGLIGGRGAGSTEFHVIRPGPAIDARFLLHYLLREDVRRNARAQMKGAAGQLRVPPEYLRNLRVSLPPIREQHRIVSAIEERLSDLDAAVAALRRVRAQLPRYQAAVLSAACEGRLVRTEAELTGRTTDASQAVPVGLPTGWTWVTLRDLGELRRGRSRHRPRDDPRLYGGAYPFVQTGDVKHSGGFVRSYSQTYNERGLAQSKLWPAGTLCITIAANIADTGILTFEACFPDSVVGLVHRGDPATLRFVELFLRTAKGNLERFAPATAQRNINVRTLTSLPVPLPPLMEQRRIVGEVDRRLSLADALQRAIDAALARAPRMRQAILKCAFEGTLAPQDPKDEPAGQLLASIRASRAAAAKPLGRRARTLAS